MKKLIFMLTVLFTILAFTNCETLPSVVQEPVISLHSVDLASLSFNGAQLICKVQVRNPNRFNIPFPETDWEFFINANSFISGTVKNNRQIRAQTTTIVDVPVNLNYLEIFNTFRSLKGNREAGYRVALGIKIPLPVLGERIWNLEHQGVLPIPQMPRLTAPSMRFENTTTTGTDVLVTLNVVNPNTFELPAPKISYNYMINRNSFIRGNVDNQRPLAASSTTPVAFRLQINYADVFRSFASLLTAREVSSLITLSCDFGIPAFGGETLTLEIPGTLPLRR
jgi:LEA14-like dessication related protein